MAIENNAGQLISYECSNLINEVKFDLSLYRRSKKIWAYCKLVNGVKMITDYSLEPINDAENDEWIEEMTLAELMAYLIRLNNSSNLYPCITELFYATGWTVKKFSEYFGIPERTVQDWIYGVRTCPNYLISLMNYKLVNEKEL